MAARLAARRHTCAARCRPKLEATLTCTPAVIRDAAGNAATSTVTATPSTDAGEGDVPVTLQLSPRSASADHVLGAPPATVTVRDDDSGASGGATPVPTLEKWALGLLGALLAALAGWRRRKAA